MRRLTVASLGLVVALLSLGAAPVPRPQAEGVTVLYPAGWNLVGGPAGTALNGNTRALYTFGFRDTEYRMLIVPSFRCFITNTQPKAVAEYSAKPT